MGRFGTSGELDPGEIWDLGGGAAERSLGHKGTQSREQVQKKYPDRSPLQSDHLLAVPLMAKPTRKPGQGSPLMQSWGSAPG